MKTTKFDPKDCKQIEKEVPLYLQQKLTVKDTKAFIEHIQNCPTCKEELTIQYMVSEGLTKAETDNEYNLLKGLEQKLEASLQMIKKYRVTLFFVILFVIASLTLFSIAVYLILS